MKKLLPICAVLLAAIALASMPARAQTAPTALTLNWTNYDAAWGPACTTPVTVKPCLQNSIATDITSLTPVILSAAINCTATTFTYSFTSAPAYGNHSYVVTANALDANGNAVGSGPSNVALVDIEPKLNAPVITLATVK